MFVYAVNPKDLREWSYIGPLVNVGLNLGKASGGSVGDHLHLHVVPRWAGDANFMTVIAGTKVLPQVLRETRTLLAEGWREVERDEREEKERG